MDLDDGMKARWTPPDENGEGVVLEALEQGSGGAFLEHCVTGSRYTGIS